MSIAATCCAWSWVFVGSQLLHIDQVNIGCSLLVVKCGLWVFAVEEVRYRLSTGWLSTDSCPLMVTIWWLTGVPPIKRFLSRALISLHICHVSTWYPCSRLAKLKLPNWCTARTGAKTRNLIWWCVVLGSNPEIIGIWPKIHKQAHSTSDSEPHVSSNPTKGTRKIIEPMATVK